MTVGVINIDVDIKEAHNKYIEWLNSLLADYQIGFWDGAVKSIIELAFIKKHSSLIQEIYQGDGLTISGFISVLPTDSESPILMVHQMGDGSPYLYNSSDVLNMFEFDANGYLIRFFENIVVDLTDSNGNTDYECEVVLENFFGIICPMYYVREKGTNSLVGKGLLDILFDGRESGTYLVENEPLEDYPQFLVTNKSLGKLVMDIPVLSKLTVTYEIAAGQAIYIPVTDFTTYYFKTAGSLGNIIVKKV